MFIHPIVIAQFLIDSLPHLDLILILALIIMFLSIVCQVFHFAILNLQFAFIVHLCYASFILPAPLFAVLMFKF